MNDRQITLRLVTRTAIHIGAGAGDAVTDAFVRRDASGRPLVPGTAIAGALRTLATRLAPRLGHESCQTLVPPAPADLDGHPCGCAICLLFGDVNPAELGAPIATSRPVSTAIARAGRLWVYDAVLVGGSGEVDPSRQVRDGIGIERAGRVAYRAGRTKFDLETLAVGAKFEVRLELAKPDARTDVDQEERLLAAVLSEWVAGRAVIGGRSSRGLGAIEPDSGEAIVYRKFDLDDPEALFTYIREDDPWASASTVDRGWLSRRIAEVRAGPIAPATANAAATWVELAATVQFAGAMLVGDPSAAAAVGFDQMPVSDGAGQGMPIIPGSSLKGVLRSQAERIARTVAAHSICRKTDGPARTELFRVRCPACDPLVNEGPLTSCDKLLKSSPVVTSLDEVDDRHLCLACQLFGSVRRGSRLRIEDARFVGDAEYKMQDFLAIDRFTGGGADRLKFDAKVLWQPSFRVRLRLENPADWEIGWLLLTLRDVIEGLASVGFGGAKGFGDVASAIWNARLGYLVASDIPGGVAVPGEPVGDGVFNVLTCNSDDVAGWYRAAGVWVAAFVKTVNEFEREARPRFLPALPADSYFGSDAEALYPITEILDG